MGLLQKAVETYDSHIEYASQYREVQSMMAPIGHIVTQAKLEITLDEDGNFVAASMVDKSEPKIVIPATESSAGRTSIGASKHPHPLCEQISYLIPANQEKFTCYVTQLADWARSEYSHKKLTPILHYVKGGTLISDLVRCGVISVNDQGRPEDERMLVRWRVYGSQPEACWLDHTLFDAFTAYCIAMQAKEPMFCMVSGQEAVPAEQHPKGIVPTSGNAKLISSNDDNGFTYRGRFEKEWQAATVSYITSQKAHNALRWLVQEQGINQGGRIFLCWNPKGKTITPPHLPFRSSKPIFAPSDYKDDLLAILNGKKKELALTDDVVVAAFDAATTGRLSLTYYSELQAFDFLQRLYDWDISCCWPHWKFGIESPMLKQIVNCAFGTQRTEKGKGKLEADERILRQQMQRLIACRVDRAPIGADIVKALMGRASRPQAYDSYVWEDVLFTACAVIRKYRMDRFKEEWNMALEPEKKDRSYQFGRLLAVMEKVERDTYDGESREPNAIRMLSVFCQRPMHTAKNIQEQLARAYFPRLNPNSRNRYKKLMGEIMMIISEFPQADWNKPLEDSYLMGYYLQRNALYTKQTNNEMED